MTASKSTHHRLWGIVLFAYWAALFVGTHLPLGGLDIPGPDSDKLLHTAAYAGLALLACCFIRPAPPSRPRMMFAILLALSTYGAMDELLQYPVRGRQPAVGDWVADTVGIALGLAAYAAIDVWMIRRGRRHPVQPPEPTGRAAGRPSNESAKQ